MLTSKYSGNKKGLIWIVEKMNYQRKEYLHKRLKDKRETKRQKCINKLHISRIRREKGNINCKKIKISRKTK